jgi:hypothetical protein
MTIDEAIELAEEFLQEYLLRDEFQTVTDKHGEVNEIAMVLQYVAEARGGIEIEFTIDATPTVSEDGPEVAKLMQQAVEALKAAHPEVTKYSIRIGGDAS